MSDPRPIGADEEWGGELGRYLVGPGSIWMRAAILIALTIAFSNLLVSDWLELNLLAWVRESIAHLVAALFGATGFEVRLDGDEVNFPQGGITIVNACIGVDAGLFLSAAVLVFAATWRARAAGVLLVFGAMLAMNFVRVASLAYLLTTSRSLFDLFHYYVWPALIVMTCLAVLLLWARQLTLQPTRQLTLQPSPETPR